MAHPSRRRDARGTSFPQARRTRDFLQPEVDDCTSCAADVMRFAAKTEGADGGLAAKPFVDARAETACAKAVDDADFVDAGHDAAVDERLQLL